MVYSGASAFIPTGSRLRWGSDPMTGDWWFEGRVSPHDLADLDLDPFDRAVLRQPIEGAADVLQSAEIIFRRMAEQAKAVTTPTPSQAQDVYGAAPEAECTKDNPND